MTTPELLEKATARPWRFSDEHEPHVRSKTGLSTVAITNTSDSKEARANAELIVRAVSSFEAMREALRAYIDSCSDSPHTIDDARAMAEKALALADGGQL